MKTAPATSIIIFVKGVLMILIGIIHTIAIRFEYQDAIKNMTAYWAASHALWFGITGMAFIFIGVIDLLSHSKLKKRSEYAWRMAFCSSAFPALLGPIGIYVFRNDSTIPFFPIIIFLLGITGIAALLINRNEFHVAEN